MQVPATVPVAAPDLLLISLFAFGVVFLLLALLAGIMHLLTRIFPVRPADGDASVPDPALLAAIAGAAAAAHPGMAVTHIEESR
jgi:hypothetical protein